MPAYTVKDFFENTWKNFLSLAGESAAASAAQMPAVKQKIEEAKTFEAKNILFKFFPVLLLALIILLATKILKF